MNIMSTLCMLGAGVAAWALLSRRLRFPLLSEIGAGLASVGLFALGLNAMNDGGPSDASLVCVIFGALFWVLGLPLMPPHRDVTTDPVSTQPEERP